MRKYRKLSKFSKRLLAFIVLGVICIPISRIFAYDNLVYTITTDGNFTLAADGKHLVVNGTSFVDVQSSTGENINDDVTLECTNNTCVYTVANQPAGIQFSSFNGFNMKWGSNNNFYEFGTVLTHSENIVITSEQKPDPGFDPNPWQPFDGKTYLIWSCGNGVCYHYFDDMQVDNHGVFIKDTDVTADNKANEHFDVHANYKFFASKNNFEAWQEDYKTYKGIQTIDWTTVDPEDCIGGPIDMREYEEQAVAASVCTREVDEDTFHHCVDNYVAGLGVFNSRAQYQPVGEPTLNNAYVSYADRNFKAIIYNSDYRALSIGSLEDLTYYPNTYTNELTRQDSYDVSDTSEYFPTDIDMVLLQDTINLRVLNYNGFAVSSITPLDVPAGAVNVTNNNNGTFTIKFNSNFYDEVVFKVTDTSNHEYFIRIVRKAMYTDSVDTARGRGISVSYFYYDRSTSESDYLLTAKITYTDGTTKFVELENARHIDDGLGNFSTELEEDLENPTRKEWPKGKGLKVASFKYDLTSEEVKNISTIFVNAEYKGSTATNYAGAFTGSGEGQYVDIERGGMD